MKVGLTYMKPLSSLLSFLLSSILSSCLSLLSLLCHFGTVHFTALKARRTVGTGTQETVVVAAAAQQACNSRSSTASRSGSLKQGEEFDRVQCSESEEKSFPLSPLLSTLPALQAV